MADYDWFDRGPTSNERAANDLRPKGLIAVWDMQRRDHIKYYLCRRGCGTLVWDPEAHMQNVCRDFNPVVGDD